MKLRQIWIIASSFGIAIGTVPLALSIIPPELWLLYIAWKLWLFVVTPAVFLYLLSKK